MYGEKGLFRIFKKANTNLRLKEDRLAKRKRPVIIIKIQLKPLKSNILRKNKYIRVI